MKVVHDDNTIAGFFGDYRYLSNFWYADMKIGSSVWKTNEHYYQAMKSVNPAYRTIVMNAPSPEKAKLYGSAKGMKFLGFDIRPDWEDIKLAVMSHGLTAKFTQNTALMRMLRATGDKVLIEENNWGDTFWGQVDGVGDNELGKALMALRDHSKDVVAG